MTRIYNGVPLDPETGRFKPTGKEETKVLGIRLPVSLIEKINQFPDKSDWLKEVLTQAVEDRLND